MSDSYSFDEIIDRGQVPALKKYSQTLGAAGQDVFAAGVADMDFRVAPVIAEALAQRLAHGVFGYEAQPESLPHAIRDWFLSRHNWQISSEHVLRAPNVLNGLSMAVSLFTKPGQGVIIQPPVFMDFMDIVSDNERQIAFNPLLFKDGRYEMDFADLETRAEDPNNTALMLCNPHNPVGRVWTRDELRQVGEICRRHNVLVISDEIFADVTFSAHPYTPFASVNIANQERAITCISPAKGFNLSGCSAAFLVVANGEFRRQLRVEQERHTVNKNNAFANVAMEAAYREGGPWLDEALSYLEGNLALLRQELADIGDIRLVEPEGTYLAWMDFRDLGLTARELNQFLREKALWSAIPGHSFGPGGEGFARVNFACPRAVLRQAVHQLKAAMAKA